jgi:hypothetical protein
LTPHIFSIRGYHLFVLIKGKFKFYEQFKQSLYNSMMARSSFLYENNETGSVIFERLTIYSEKYCGGSKSMKVVEFKNGQFSKQNFEIFKQDFDNLHGCELTIPTFHRPPALIIDEQSGKMQGGFDWEILKLLAYRMNFTIKELRMNGSNQWGTYDVKTGRMTEALREVHEGPAHLVIGNYILRSNRIEYFDISVSYFVTPMVLVIPFGDRYTSFEKLVKPFDIAVWSLMLTMFLISLVTIFIINWKFEKIKDFVYGTKIRSPVINMAIAIFGGSQRRLPMKNFARFLLMMFLIFCLVLRNVYQSLLFIYMTRIQRHPEIQSLRDVYDGNFVIYTYPSNFGLLPEIEK